MLRLEQKSKFPLLLFVPLLAILAMSSFYTASYGYSVMATGDKSSKIQDTLKVGTKIDGIVSSTLGKIVLLFRHNESLKKGMPVSKKLIVINGKIMEYGTIGGVENVDYFLISELSQGIKKYGNKAEFGVIEAFGANAKTLNIPVPPPSGLPPID